MWASPLYCVFDEFTHRLSTAVHTQIWLRSWAFVPKSVGEWKIGLQILKYELGIRKC